MEEAEAKNLEQILNDSSADTTPAATPPAPAVEQAPESVSESVIEVVRSVPDRLTATIDVVDFTESTIYMMGLSFIIGVLFTILILLVLDFMRRNSDN